MWTSEHTQQTDVPPAAIWVALRDIHEGRTSAPGGDRFEIHGPFAVGTEISVTPAGQDTFRSVIVDLEPEQRYADETRFADVTLRFAHTLRALADGGTRITHELRIQGPGADSVGPELGPQISADFPQAMEGLIAAGRAVAGA
jgi:hypothetical protein